MIRFACCVCKQEFFALVDPPPRVCSDCAEASLAVPFLDTKDARIAELDAEANELEHEATELRGEVESKSGHISYLETRIRDAARALRDALPGPHEPATLEQLVDASVARIAELEAENARLDEAIAFAMKEARKRMPDYPWRDTWNNPAQIVWALGEGYRGVSEANLELHGRIAELKTKLAALTTRQPMETAPMDGAKVWLVPGGDWTGQRPFIGRHDPIPSDVKFLANTSWVDSGTGLRWAARNLLGWYALPEEVSR